MSNVEIAQYIIDQIKLGTEKGTNLEELIVLLLADDFEKLDWVSASEIVLKEQGVYDGQE